MARGRRVILSALVALCLGTPSRLCAQRDVSGTTGLGSIYGRVILQDSPNQTPEQILVQLTKGSGFPIAESYTTGNGQFAFSNVPAGDFEVRVNLPGYHPFFEKVSIRTGSTRVQVQIHLRRLEPAARPGVAGPSVSVGEMLAPAGARREFDKALEKSRKGDASSAERHFKKAVALYPAYLRAWIELGQLYERSNRSAEALQSYRQALTHDGKNRGALLATARLLNDHGRYIEALRASAQLEQLYPADARNHLEIARGLLGAGKAAEAEAAARDLERGPHAEIPEVHVVLFSILRSRQDTAGAAAQLRSYLKEMDKRNVAPTNPAMVHAREMLAKLESEIAAAK